MIRAEALCITGFWMVHWTEAGDWPAGGLGGRDAHKKYLGLPFKMGKKPTVLPPNSMGMDGGCALRTLCYRTRVCLEHGCRIGVGNSRRTVPSHYSGAGEQHITYSCRCAGCLCGCYVGVREVGDV